MAQKVTFAEASQAQSYIESEKTILRKTKDKAQRDQILKNIADAQATITAYEQQQKNEKNAGQVADLNSKVQDLIDSRDIAKARGTSTAKYDGQIKKLAGQITELGGKPIPLPTDLITESTTFTQPMSIAGVTPAAASTSTKTTGNKPPAGNKPSVSTDAKTNYINYLRETFKNVGDPKAQAQIDALFAEASKPNSGWTEATFMERLNQISWWQNQLPSLQNFFLLSHDPRKAGTLTESRTQKSAYIQELMAKQGIQINNVDPTTGKIIDNSSVLAGIVDKAIANKWTDSQIEHYMTTSADLHFTSGGIIQSAFDNIQRNANIYGIDIDPTLKKTIQYDLADPTSGRDMTYWTNQMKNMAMDMYKPFAQSIRDGANLYTATSKYRSTMADLLEVAPDQISWKDLMGGVIDSNTGNARTVDDFTKQVKQNPLWQRTANARQTYMGVANDLMSMFGITG